MSGRKVALLIAAFAGLTTLAWKSVPENVAGGLSSDFAGGNTFVWDGVSKFCHGLHRDLSGGEADGVRVRQYIVARALDDFCGEENPALASES